MLPVDPRLWQTDPMRSALYGLQTANDYTPIWAKRYQVLMGFAVNGEGGTVVTEGRALLLVADRWTVTVDGRAAWVEMENGCQRGFFVETTGEHEIAMRFWPWSRTGGAVVTLRGVVAAFGPCRPARAKSLLR